jgi:hypothetical protein
LITFQGIPSSCEDLRKMGHTLSGLYNVKKDSTTDLVFCDMTKLDGVAGKVLRLSIPVEAVRGIEANLTIFEALI